MGETEIIIYGFISEISHDTSRDSSPNPGSPPAPAWFLVHIITTSNKVSSSPFSAPSAIPALLRVLASQSRMTLLWFSPSYVSLLIVLPRLALLDQPLKSSRSALSPSRLGFLSAWHHGLRIGSWQPLQAVVQEHFPPSVLPAWHVYSRVTKPESRFSELCQLCSRQHWFIRRTSWGAWTHCHSPSLLPSMHLVGISGQWTCGGTPW